MSSSDTDKSSVQHINNEATNPFISFRRFADEQMSYLLHSLIGLPSASNNDSTSLSKRSASDQHLCVQAANNLERHFTREPEEIEEILSIWKRIYDNNGSARGEEENSVRQCPYRPFDPEMLQDDQKMISDVVLPAFGFPYPSHVRLESPTDGCAAGNLWPIAYIASSSYSPLRLERTSPLSEQGNKWRNAFEDLIALRDGKPMLDDDSRRSNGSGAVWMASMLERGMFGGGWKPNRQSPHETEDLNTARMLENDFKEDKVTELDMYERFLGSQYPSMQKSSSASESNPKAPISTLENAGPPSLISTLTTTERNSLPDGSIHTKVMLKKRFSDGREESTETVHTTYDPQQPLLKPSASIGSDSREIAENSLAAVEPKEPTKKGWFWS